MATRFETDLFPLMTRAEGGCQACHYPDSGRMLSMGPTGSDTFYRLRAAGFLELNRNNSMLDRLSRTDETAMPSGGPYWTQDELNLLACFVENLDAFESSAPPADESFPVELLEPYTGPSATEYDNTLLTYEQLKGRVAVQFEDDWVRNGEDKFTTNIALFGGVDFESTFVPNRQPTADYLLGLDLMAIDVCRTAVDNGTGPFVGIDVTAAIEEELPSTASTVQAEGTDIVRTGGCFYSVTNGVGLCSNGSLGFYATIEQAGDYVISATAKGAEAGTELPIMTFAVDGLEVARFDVPGKSYITYSSTLRLEKGSRFLTFSFINDYYNPTLGLDRNLAIDSMGVKGPIAGSTAGEPGAEAATYARLAEVFDAILLRSPITPPPDDELTPLYALLRTLEDFNGDRLGAWAGVCEGLIKHPDFIFTRPPSFDTAPEPDRERLLLVKTALDLLNRPPTWEELDRYDRGTSRRELLHEWLGSDEMLNAYFHWMRLRLESDGTGEMDEPARLWTYLMKSNRPLFELLTADYSVDQTLTPVARSSVYGPTGVLTMAGYIKHKPGLPHYNYSARVLSDFMGYVFEVPPEIVDQRAGSTPSSTVEEGSVCYSCHYLLTPLAHQRLRWDDQGDYQDTDSSGAPIDDSDRDMVEAYPFKGSGMSSFAAQAVRKEIYLRTLTNSQFDLFFARPLRYDTDERELYYSLWSQAHDQGAGFTSILETILESESYVNPVGSRPEDQVRYEEVWWSPSAESRRSFAPASAVWPSATQAAAPSRARTARAGGSAHE